MNPLIWQAIIAPAIALAGVLAAQWTARRAQREQNSNAGYDQVQEDLKELREERKRDKAAAALDRAEDRAEVEYLQALVLHLDNEVVGLRNDIQAGTVPPLQPRPERPKRPVKAAS